MGFQTEMKSFTWERWVMYSSGLIAARIVFCGIACGQNSTLRGLPCRLSLVVTCFLPEWHFRLLLLLLARPGGALPPCWPLIRSCASPSTAFRYPPRRSGKSPSPPNSPWQRSNSTHGARLSPRSPVTLSVLSLLLCALCASLCFPARSGGFYRTSAAIPNAPNRQRPPAPLPLHLCGGAAGCYLWNRLQLIVIPGLAATLVLRCGSKTGLERKWPRRRRRKNP